MKKTMLVTTMVIALAMSTMGAALASTPESAEILSPTDNGLYYLDVGATERSVTLAASTDANAEFAYAVRTAAPGNDDYDYSTCLRADSDELAFSGGGGTTDSDGVWSDDVNLNAGKYCFVFNAAPGTTQVGADFRPVVTFVVGVAESKDACKNGGWETFGDYRNQGQCVSEFARNK